MSLDRLTRERVRPGSERCGTIGILAIGLLPLLNQTGPATTLSSLPEAQLRPPDSEPLADGSRDRVDEVLGTTNAAWWTIFGIDASLEEVRGFYDAELR